MDATASVVVTDADGLTATGTITFDVTPVNDTPTAADITHTVTYTEDDSSVELTDIVITEVDRIQAGLDDGTLETVSVTITLSDSNAGTFSADSGNGETFSSGVWSISGVSTTVANTALAAIEFLPSAIMTLMQPLQLLLLMLMETLFWNGYLDQQSSKRHTQCDKFRSNVDIYRGDSSVAIDDIVVSEVDTIIASLDDGNPEKQSQLQ